MNKLTDRQREIYKFILYRQRLSGNLPTCKEIADKFNFASPNSATCHIKALRAKGYLAPKKDKKARIELPRKPKGA